MDEQNTQLTQAKVTLPRFNQNNVKIWLQLCDQAFTLHGVENPLMRSHIILQFLPVSLQEVVHTALSETGNEYVKLKDTLLKHFELHALDRMNRFYADKQLGSRTATTYLAQMRKLLGEPEGNEPSLALRAQFIQALPVESRAICVSSGKSLNEMAKMSDEIRMAVPSEQSVTAAASA